MTTDHDRALQTTCFCPHCIRARDVAPPWFAPVVCVMVALGVWAFWFFEIRSRCP